MPTFRDWITNVAHTVYFGTQKPSREHAARSWEAETIFLTQGASPIDSKYFADAREASAKNGAQGDWRIQRCLVSTLNKCRTKTALRIVAISDTHMKHLFLNNRIPDGDILIHCGDILMSSVRYSQAENLKRLHRFNRWLGTLPHSHKIVIAGNHDGLLQQIGPKRTQQILSEATYLCDSGVKIGGLNIWGTPVSWGHSKNDAFQQGHNERHLQKIPQTVDLLMTHGFPFAKLRNFQDTIRKIRPRLHLCGHWHGGAGVHFWGGGVTTINCSLLNGKYRLNMTPVVVDLPCQTKQSCL